MPYAPKVPERMYTSGDVQKMTAGRVQEFQKRLERNVSRIICDVEPDDTKFMQAIAGLSPDNLRSLANVLRLEILQIVDAVSSAK